MNSKTYRALVVTESEDKKFTREIIEQNIADLPAGDVLIKVHYSSLNYKDALSATGNKGVTRKYPHTPGIDASGVVESSTSEQFMVGEEVIVTSYDLGMNTSGGFGQYIRVPAEWVVKLPKNMTLRESMIYGTAGFTAALSIYRLVENDLKPEDGAILVSGATGGVGSIAVSILAEMGYKVVAINGLKDRTDYLKTIGAYEVISIEEATDQSDRPVLKGRWAGGIDTVGGDILATMIKSTCSNGTVTCCGNAASPGLPLTVFPFILRGVSLIGIDSQNCRMDLRQKTWDRLAEAWKIKRMEEITQEITLEELGETIDKMLNRQHKGRSIVRMVD